VFRYFLESFPLYGFKCLKEIDATPTFLVIFVECTHKMLKWAGLQKEALCNFLAAIGVARLYGGCHFVLAQVKDKRNGILSRWRKKQKKRYRGNAAEKPTASITPSRFFAFCIFHFAFCKIRQN